MELQGRSLRGDFLRFVIPSVISQWLFSLYAMVDAIFVSRGVSEVALGAINVASPFLSIMFSTSLIFAVGSSTLIAVHLGRGERREAEEVYTLDVAVSVVLGLAITAGALLFLDPFCRFLGGTEANIGYIRAYIRHLAPFAVFFGLGYAFEILVKVDGFPRYATGCIISGCLLNCLLDYLLVIRFPFGVEGAAVATGASQLFATVLYLIHFLGKRTGLHLRPIHHRLRDIWTAFKLGLSSGLTELSAGAVTFLFVHAINRHLGDDAVISYSIIDYMNTLVVMSMVGIAQGAQPLISYHHGRGDARSARTLLRYSLLSVAVLSAAVFAGSLLGADGIVSLFLGPDLPELREYSAGVFRIFSTSFLLVGYNVVLGGYFTDLERPGEALVISACRSFLTMAAGLVIMIALLGGRGIWWAATLSEAMTGVVSLALLWRWKRRGL